VLLQKGETVSTENTARAEVTLPQGTIRYRDLGEGEPLLFVHGALVNGELWRKAAAVLAAGHRCIIPDLPLGSHAVPMNAEADLSPLGLAGLIDGFAEALGLERVTLVGNDTGGALCQLVAVHYPRRVERLVLTNCDSYDRFPPPPFHLFKVPAYIPGGVWAIAQPFRLRGTTRRIVAMLAHEPVPDDVLDAWGQPAIESAGVRRDIRKLLRGLSTEYTLEAAERLRSFERPALLAWAPEDPYFKIDYAERMAREMPNCRLERVPDSLTFVPWDQPERLGALIGEFVREQASAEAPA
jgi:pimeloyl-ACP methyl ester carboxylesterase